MIYKVYQWGLSLPDECFEDSHGTWMEIIDGEFEEKIKELTKKFDIMIRNKDEIILYFDDYGRHFRTR